MILGRAWLLALLCVGSGCVARALDLPYVVSSPDGGTFDLSSPHDFAFSGTIPAPCAGTQNVVYLSCGAPNCGLDAPQTITTGNWEGLASIGDMMSIAPGEAPQLVAISNPQVELLFYAYPLTVGTYANLQPVSLPPPAGNSQPTFDVSYLPSDLDWQPSISGSFTVYEITTDSDAPTVFTASFEANNGSSTVSGCVHYQQ
jgi:hypothetical protein